MAAYTVLATRYRPRAFDEVVGQEDAARVLRSAVVGGRAAHAYLFSGPRGVGKTSMARILAKAWNCLQGESAEPCGACAVCRSIDETGDCLDVVEIDGASHNKVENVRELIEKIRFRPVEARYRVYIVDEVHMLSTSAFNALLKTLEEPPEHARFILATTEPLKVPETIRSRCQGIDFRRLAAREMAMRMETVCAQEQVQVPDGLLERIARHARGGLRDALSLLDQLITYGDGRPTDEAFEQLTGRLAPELMQRLVTAALEGRVDEALSACSQALEGGARPADLIEQLTDWLQGLLVTAAGGQPADRTEEERAQLDRLASATHVDQLVAMLDVLVEAERRLRQRHDGRLVVELAVVTLARTPQLQPIAELLAGRAPAGSTAATPSARPSAPARSPVPAERPRTKRRAAPAAGGPPEGFAGRFIELAGRGARSLGSELTRCRSISLQGDELVIQGPQGGFTPLFDPAQDRALKQRLEETASELAGRKIRMRIEVEPSGRSPRRAPDDDVEGRILGDWPGAERVDF
jgi:DNA polymerase-3 subunit gamma/tau